MSDQFPAEYVEPRLGYVYVMRAPDLGLCKIGLAASPSARLYQVRKSNALRYAGRIDLHYSQRVVDPDAVEWLAHSLLAARWHAGEWYRVASRTAEAAVRFAGGFYLWTGRASSRHQERLVATLARRGVLADR